uniref:Uncharacterized protein n=1 Tax=Xenopus tropicalis TaxID=8364 RepID=A0A6I8QXC6_XENTR
KSCPSCSQPSCSLPSCSQPSCSQPSCSQPSCSLPSYSQPSCSLPSCSQPSCSLPSCSLPSCSLPSCSQPSCSLPSCSQPSCSQPSFIHIPRQSQAPNCVPLLLCTLGSYLCFLHLVPALTLKLYILHSDDKFLEKNDSIKTSAPLQRNYVINSHE